MSKSGFEQKHPKNRQLSMCIYTCVLLVFGLAWNKIQLLSKCFSVSNTKAIFVSVWIQDTILSDKTHWLNGLLFLSNETFFEMEKELKTLHKLCFYFNWSVFRVYNSKQKNIITKTILYGPYVWSCGQRTEWKRNVHKIWYNLVQREMDKYNFNLKQCLVLLVWKQLHALC